MSSGGFDTPFLRRVLAAVAAVDVLSLILFIGDARAVAAAGGTLGGWTALVSSLPVRVAIAVLGAAAAVGFARRSGRLWEGTAALCALALLATAHAHLYGSPWRHLFYSGLCLAGWLLGLAFSRLGGAPPSESYARTGSLALLGAAYCSAGISKFVFAGPGWLSGLPIQAAIVAQDGLVPDGFATLYRTWVVATPAAASLLSIATVGFELAGPLMIAGPLARRCVALGLLAMHANIWVLTPILYWESMVFLLVFGFSRDDAHWQPRPADAILRDDRRFAALAVALAASAVLAVGLQGWRYARSQSARIEAAAAPIAAQPADPRPAAEPPAPALPTTRPLQSIGPFAVGSAFDGWTLEAVELSEAGIVARFAGEPGRVSFEVTCAPSEHRSPFDLGPAHIFYSSEIEFGRLEALGRTVQARVRDSSGADPCESVSSWRKRAST